MASPTEPNALCHTLETESELTKQAKREDLEPIADSAIHRIPLETLGDIFAFAIPKTLDEDGRNALLNLYLVCKFWRDAALQTHCLWNDVHVECGSGPAEDPTMSELGALMRRGGGAREQVKAWGTVNPRKILAWLKRSGALPKYLKLDITAGASSSSVKTSVMFTRIAIMLTEITPFVRLSLSVPSRGCFARLIAAFRGPGASYGSNHSDAVPCGWKRLRVKELVLGFELFGLSDQEIPDAVQKLQLNIDGYSQVFLDKPVLPPTFAGRLTSLTLRSEWSLDFLVEIVRPCASLNDLTLDLCRSGRDMYGRPWGNIDDREEDLLETLSKVHLPHLCMLALKRTDIGGLKIIDILSAPRLEQLELEFMDGVVSTWKFRIAKFKPFPETLTSLRIANFEVAQGWERILGPGRGCPTLKNLILDKIKLPVAQDEDWLQVVLWQDEERLQVTQDENCLPAFWERYPALEKLEVLNLEAASFNMVKQLSLFIAYQPGRPDASDTMATGAGKCIVAPFNPSLRSLKIMFAEESSNWSWVEKVYYDSKTRKAIVRKIKVLRRHGGMSVCIGPVLA